MAIHRQREIGMRHARAVVGDADPSPPAAVGENVDPAGAGVDGVLHQFLDHARRTLDHFAGGDAVDDPFGELADGHGFCATRGNGRTIYELLPAEGRRRGQLSPLFTAPFPGCSPSARLRASPTQYDLRQRYAADPGSMAAQRKRGSHQKFLQAAAYKVIPW